MRTTEQLIQEIEASNALTLIAEAKEKKHYLEQRLFALECTKVRHFGVNDALFSMCCTEYIQVQREYLDLKNLLEYAKPII